MFSFLSGFANSLKEAEDGIKASREFLESETEPADCDDVLNRFRADLEEFHQDQSEEYCHVKKEMTDVSSKIDQARSFLTSLEAVADKREQYLEKYGYKGLSTKNVPVIAEPDAPSESVSEPPRVMSQLEIQAIHAKYASVNQTPGSRSFISNDLNKTPSFEQLKQTEDEVDLVLKYQTPKKKRPPPEVEQEDEGDKTGILDKYKSRAVTEPAMAVQAKEEAYKPIVNVLEKYRSAKVIEKELEALDNKVELPVRVKTPEPVVTEPVLTIPIPAETVYDSDAKTPCKERGVKFDLDKYRSASMGGVKEEVFATPNPVSKPASVSVTKPAGKREVDAASILAQYSKRNRESIVQKDCSLTEAKADTLSTFPIVESKELKSVPICVSVEKENVETYAEKDNLTGVHESSVSEKPSQIFAAKKQDILAKYKNKYNASL